MLPPDPKQQSLIEVLSSMVPSKTAVNNLSSVIDSAAAAASVYGLSAPNASWVPPAEVRYPVKPSDGERAYKRLVAQINEFESQLNLREEIGARLVSAPGADVFFIDDLGFRGDLIIFHGKNEHDRPLQLVQHCTQISVLLTAYRAKVGKKACHLGIPGGTG
jgi:hypothetical protein